MKARKLKNAYRRKLRSDRIRSKNFDGRHDRWQNPELYVFAMTSEGGGGFFAYLGCTSPGWSAAITL